MPLDAIEITPVTSKKDLNDFIKLPWKIYKNDATWVPPLFSQQKATFDKKKHPFFEHSSADFFIARQGKEAVGTIAAILNNRHNKVHNENVGFFGFFETIPDYQVAEKLLDTVMEWAKKKNLDYIRGPENYSQNEVCGLLVDDFDTPPVIMMRVSSSTPGRESLEAADRNTTSAPTAVSKTGGGWSEKTEPFSSIALQYSSL